MMTSFSIFSKTNAINDLNLKFVYQSFDKNANYYNCIHSVENEMTYDWKVVCGDKEQKEFTVHLSIQKFRRDVAPRSTYELLYWITNNKIKNDSNGTSLWFSTEDDSKLFSITASQSVDHDTAGLYLYISTKEE